MQYIEYEELLFLLDVGHYFLHTQDWQLLSHQFGREKHLN
jgi:hypothetical protein